MTMKKVLASILAPCIALNAMSFTVFAAEGDVAEIGESTYATLAEAVEAANEIEGGAAITLNGDVVLGEKLTITGDVIIEGEHTITRADDYTGTLFAVNAGASLTLDSGLTIDGANDWGFDMTAYEYDLDNMIIVPTAEAEKYFTLDEDKPVAAAYMMVVNGTLNLNDVAIKNHYSKGSGIVEAKNGSTVNMDGAYITHCASATGSGLVVNASAGVYEPSAEKITVNMNEGTVIDGNHIGGNHGIFKIYLGTTFNMNGGEITNTTGWNSNGVAVGVYWAAFNMNGGTISYNSSVVGPNNGRNASIYLHSASQFLMTGGEVSNNRGRSRGGIDAPYTDGENSSTVEIREGAVLDNVSINGNIDKDISGGVALGISGGTFTQDVSKWAAEESGVAYNADSNIYYITDEVAEINGTSYTSVANAVDAAADGDTITVIAGSRLNSTVIIDKNITLDLNGESVYANNANVKPTAFRILADVTVKNGTVDARAADSYVFILGASDGSQEGNLTIESGSYYAQTTLASVTKGTLTVNGGEFQIDPYIASEGAEPDYTYLLNCIDANYNDGTAKIEVNRGSFHNFDPSNNEAEGANTNFVTEGAVVTSNNDKNLYTVSGPRTIELTPSKNIVKTNEEFTVDVKISGVDAKGVKWAIDFDEAYFELVSINTSYSQMNSNNLAPEIIAEQGVIDSANPVATYTFKSKTQAVADSAFTLTEVDIRTIVDAWEDTTVSDTINITGTCVTVELRQYEEITAKYDGTVTTETIIEGIYDGVEHTFEVTTSTPDANVTYKVNDDEETVAAPIIKDEGTYTINYRIDGALGYEPVEETVTITIGKPEYVVEVAFGEDSDYVDGTKLVLVYTNAENISFDFNGTNMLDVSASGYKYNGTESYKHIYALVVNALAVNNLSAYEAKVTLDYTNRASVISYEPNNDINFNGAVTWDDIMAVYSVIEKDEYAFSNQMSGFIKADTNRDKKATSNDAAPIISEVYGE